MGADAKKPAKTRSKIKKSSLKKKTVPISCHFHKESHKNNKQKIIFLDSIDK